MEFCVQIYTSLRNIELKFGINTYIGEAYAPPTQKAVDTFSLTFVCEYMLYCERNI